MATNVINGHRYIGVTGRLLARRIWEHFYDAHRARTKGAFYAAIRKHGNASFSFSEIESFSSRSEALETERRLILETSPEYNSTVGGEGYSRPVISEAQKDLLRLLHKGNTYRLGQSHSEATKQKLRDHGIKNRSKWAVYAADGPKASSKEVICLDDGMIFPSASAAARTYGAGSAMISEVCNKKRATAMGRVFRYIGDACGGPEEAAAVKLARRGTSENRPIICLNTLRVFQTNIEAVEATGISKNTIKRSCMQGGQRGTMSGMEFCFLDEWCPNPL